MSIGTFIKNLINTILDGSFERVKLISHMNAAFKDYFISGDSNRLCKVSISHGCIEYAHEMSSIWLRSGFLLNVENDSGLRDSEVLELAQYITCNEAFVRQLMSMGFDTLTVKGKTTGICHNFSLKKYANLTNYYIAQ